MKPTLRIAFAGNPNSGKTTMYNALTGRNEKVGNWAGVTVDRKEAPIKKAYAGGPELIAVDLASRPEVKAADRRRFAFVNQVAAKVETRKVLTRERGFQDAVDTVITNPVAGLLIFAAVMFAVFDISQSTVGPWIAARLCGWVAGILDGAAVNALFAGAFFEDASWAGTLMYFAGIALILAGALLVNRIAGHRGRKSFFIIELPEYKAPSLKRAFLDMCSRGWAYIVKAGTIILVCNAAVFIMQSFKWQFRLVEDGMESTSILASIASPIGILLVPIIGTAAIIGLAVVAAIATVIVMLIRKADRDLASRYALNVRK